MESVSAHPLRVSGTMEAASGLYVTGNSRKLQLSGGLSGMFVHLPEFPLCLATD
ncbi:MAG: hypothetical protein U0996_08450 [Planctomycetaceae bacterium]